jgi:hypothetical protein
MDLDDLKLQTVYALKTKPRDWKVDKNAPKVRLEGEFGSEQNKLRGDVYRYAHARLAEASELGMHFEVIALCDMMITDRLEALCQHLLKEEDLQFETMSSNQALSALEVAIKDNRRELNSSVEWKDLRKSLREFFNGRNACLHSFVLIKNAASDVTLKQRVEFLEATSEDGIKLLNAVGQFTARERQR